MKLIDERGAAAVTIRSLALEVEATPMALYNHFASQRDLLTGATNFVVFLGECE